MFTKKSLIFSVISMTVLCFAVQCMAADNCERLMHSVLYVVGNGFSGNSGVYKNLSATKQADGTYVFNGTLQMTNEQADPLVGTCKNRHIQFTRIRAGVFVQKYDGWLFEKFNKANLQEMAGTITSNNATNWGWYGWFGDPQPK